MYYKSHMDVRSRNHFCRGKTINIAYSECVSVVIVIQDAKRMHRITHHWWCKGSTAFFHTVS